MKVLNIKYTVEKEYNMDALNNLGYPPTATDVEIIQAEKEEFDPFIMLEGGDMASTLEITIKNT